MGKARGAEVRGVDVKVGRIGADYTFGEAEGGESVLGRAVAWASRIIAGFASTRRPGIARLPVSASHEESEEAHVAPDVGEAFHARAGGFAVGVTSEDFIGEEERLQVAQAQLEASGQAAFDGDDFESQLQ